LHKRYKVEVSPERVMIVPGGKVTMFETILMFASLARIFYIPIPVFRFTDR